MDKKSPQVLTPLTMSYGFSCELNSEELNVRHLKSLGAV